MRTFRYEAKNSSSTRTCIFPSCSLVVSLFPLTSVDNAIDMTTWKAISLSLLLLCIQVEGEKAGATSKGTTPPIESRLCTPAIECLLRTLSSLLTNALNRKRG